MSFLRKSQCSFFLTSNCNLNCYYCYIPKLTIDKKDQVIDLNFAKKGLDDYFSLNRSKTVRFFSAGEPTLAFERMKEIYDYAKIIAGDELKIELETNGYFGNTIRDWIANHVDHLWISCDGPPKIQAVQRPSFSNQSSYDLVYNNIEFFSKIRNIQFGVRATISKENLNNQIKLLKFFNRLGVRYVAASPTYASTVNKDIVTPSLYEFAESFLPAYNYAIKHDMFYSTLLIVNFDEPVDIYCQCCLPNPRYTSDGFVSCCDWAAFGPSYQPGLNQQCVYGYYDKSLDSIVYDQSKIKNIRKRNVEYLGNNFCKGCEVLDHCAGGCLGKMLAGTGDFYKATDDWCKACLFLWKNIEVPKGGFPFIHP